MTMVSVEDAELLRATGPATPMGDLFRRFWHPFLLTGDLPAPDGDPIRVKILWEDLVAFRDSHGRVGLLDNACPHRNMPLADGFNANGRLTCRYHSWAFDVTGRCVDDQPGAESVRARAYPTVESAGMIWAYLGPPDSLPPPLDFDVCRLPADHVIAMRTPARGAYLKVVGEHIDAALAHTGDDNATIEIEESEAGLRLLARRRAGDEPLAITVARDLLPTHTIIAAPEAAATVLIVVPVDAWNSMRFAVAVSPDRPFTAAEREAIRDRGPLLTATVPSPPAGAGPPAAHATPSAAILARLRRRLIDGVANPSADAGSPGPAQIPNRR